MSCARNYGLPWKKNMPREESPIQCTERLLALPPRKRLESFRELTDQTFRREVIRALPAAAYSEILAESMVENLNRNVRERMAAQKPSQAA